MNPTYSFIMLDICIIVILVVIFLAKDNPNSRGCALILAQARKVKLLGCLTSNLLNTPTPASGVVQGVHQSQGPCTSYLLCLKFNSPDLYVTSNNLTFRGMFVCGPTDPRSEPFVVLSVPCSTNAFLGH